jgi:ribosomal protein S18 acetylase RimI-like enzyme
MMTETASSLSIRACRPEDIDAVLELWRQADATPGVTDTTDDLRRATADSPAHVLAAEVESRIVGSIIGTFDGWRGNIYRLAVHPDHRRQGVARALVAEVEKRLTEQGAKRITALSGCSCRSLPGCGWWRDWPRRRSTTTSSPRSHATKVNLEPPTSIRCTLSGR